MDLHKSLIDQFVQLTPDPGIFPSTINGVSLIRSDTPTDRTPIIYDTVIYVVLQGQKRSYLGSKIYQYDSMNFLALSVPLPLEGHVTMATQDKPFLALKIEIQPAMLKELLVEMTSTESEKGSSSGICVCPMSIELRNATVRLINYLQDDQKAKILGPMVIKELLFYALQGPQASQLTAFNGQGRHFRQIAQVIRHIQGNFQDSMDVEQLAMMAGMSSSAFHHHFKSVTSNTPIQYIKAVRLHQAHQLVKFEQTSVSEAAWEVGYQSLSQFSREYKRLFGSLPSEA